MVRTEKGRDVTGQLEDELARLAECAEPTLAVGVAGGDGTVGSVAVVAACATTCRWW